MQSLLTPGDPGYKPSQTLLDRLFDRLFNKNRNQPFSPKGGFRDPMMENQLNKSFDSGDISLNEELLSLYDEMSDASSVRS